MPLREALTAVVVALPFGVGAVSSAEGPRPEFRFTDPQIVESSGLAVVDGLVVTVNDSGDDARVFAVDPARGRTVGVTRWAGDPVDVEALAPAGPGQVWVGDIGDNVRERATVRVTRVPVGRGERTVEGAAYDLAYPGGPADAEALLAHPITGRLYLVTKAVLGGRVYAAPRVLDPDRVNRLRPIGQVMPLVTDGAFLPDGRRLVLRDYSRAAVYSFPDLAPVADVPLPPQPQGEGIALDGDRLLVSTEGVRSPVHRVSLPQPAPATRSPSASPSPTPVSREGQELSQQDVPRRDAWPWLLGGLVGAAMIVALLRSLRPR